MWSKDNVPYSPIDELSELELLEVEVDEVVEDVEFVEIINSNTIKMRVWERGVGTTLACGSGACAAVYASWKKNLTKNKVEVVLEKGSLFINILNEQAIMTGPAEISFRGSLEI